MQTLVFPASAPAAVPLHPRVARPSAASTVRPAHLARLGIVVASLALLGLSARVSERAARPNGPAAWQAAARAIPEAGR